MESDKELTRISKFLSLLLRHQPQLIGLELDERGWAVVDDLLERVKTKGMRLDRALLDHVVATNNKKRFGFSEDGTKIRASQGHSVRVDLGYTQSTPPAVLFHGTAEKNLVSIMAGGLQKRARQHVHPSADKETAVKVGQRHGKPVVLTVASGEMSKDGYAFYPSANGVWLVDAVPANYLRLPQL